MFTDIDQIIMVLFFIMLMLAIYKPAKSAFNFETFPSLVISGCVSALCIIGMKSTFGESFKVILLPYIAMGISILLIMLITTICKLFKNDEKNYNTPRTTHFNEADSARKARGANCNDFSEINLTSTNSQRQEFLHSPMPQSLVSHKEVKKDKKLKNND